MNIRPPSTPRLPTAVDIPRPVEHVHHFHRTHCRYEVRTGPKGTTVVATPLTQRAKDWMADMRITFLQIRCMHDFAGMTVRNIECAIDTK